MTRDAAALGKHVAERYLAEGPRPSARDLARRLSVAVVEWEAPPPAQPDLRAEYQAAPPRIVLYRDSLARLSDALRADPRAEALACDLEEVHLAHEVFHHLEVGGRFGPLRPEEVETAAHAFVRTFCGLSFDPGELSGIR